jgi:plastocyanin
MSRFCTFAFALLSFVLAGILSVGAQTTPAPVVDRIGFPDNYQTDFVPLFAFDRPDNGQIRVVYGNHVASNAKKGEPYPYGSILVMETWRARTDAQNNRLKDADGRYIRDTLTAIFVMRKERGFGVEYEQNRTGEWEYVAYRPDRTYNTEPRNSFSCAQCHLMATGARDWVFRSFMQFEGTSSTGEIPDGVLQQYLFIPSTIRVKAGSTVTWLNDDEVDHRIAITTGQVVEAPTMPWGTTFRARFNSTGEYNVTCRIHPTMRATVIVEP